MTAPLGGLPAVESQVAARQQQPPQRKRRNSSPDSGSDDGDDRRNASPGHTPTKKTRVSESETRHVGSSDESPPKAQGLIKARGTYYPLTAFPTSMPQGPVMHRDGSPPRTEVQASKLAPIAITENTFYAT
jgi:hypothetical protein